MKRTRVAILVLAMFAASGGALAIWFVRPWFMAGVLAGLIIGGAAEAVDYGGRWRPRFERWLRGDPREEPGT